MKLIKTLVTPQSYINNIAVYDGSEKRGLREKRYLSEKRALSEKRRLFMRPKKGHSGHYL